MPLTLHYEVHISHRCVPFALYFTNSWSGGYQLFTGVKGGCNMMRVVSLHPDHFSKHFIYHVANNKQKQLSRQRMVRADHLWGQLNSVKKAAQQEMTRLVANIGKEPTAR
jgi:hypothetical protein